MTDVAVMTTMEYALVVLNKVGLVLDAILTHLLILEAVVDVKVAVLGTTMLFYMIPYNWRSPFHPNHNSHSSIYN